MMSKVLISHHRRLLFNWQVLTCVPQKIFGQKLHVSYKQRHGPAHEVCTRRLERLNAPKNRYGKVEDERYPFQKMERGDFISCLTFLTNVKASLLGSDYELFNIASADLALTIKLQSLVERKIEIEPAELKSEIQEAFDRYRMTMPEHFSAQMSADLFVTQITTVEHDMIADIVLLSVMELLEKRDLLSVHVIAMSSQKIQEKYDSDTLPQWFDKYANILHELMKKTHNLQYLPTVLAVACYSTLIKGKRWEELLEDGYLFRIVPVKEQFYNSITSLYRKLGKSKESKLPEYFQRHINMVSNADIPEESRRKAMRFLYSRIIPKIAENIEQRSTIEQLLEIIRRQCSYPLELNLRDAGILRDHWNRLSESIERKRFVKGNDGNLTMVHPLDNNCKSCGKQLESEHVTDNDIQVLIDLIFNQTLHDSKQKIWRVATPREFKLLKDYIEVQAPYDLVIDYLNVNSLMKFNFPYEMMWEFLTRFPRKLCVTRRHTRHKIHPMFKHCDFFYTDNDSSDDVFLIYAALKSGKNCKFMTGDDFTDHSMLFSDENHVDLFSKWIRLSKIKQHHLQDFFTNQIHNTKIGIQKQDTGWHMSVCTIEMTDRSHRSGKGAPWLCLRC